MELENLRTLVAVIQDRDVNNLVPTKAQLNILEREIGTLSHDSNCPMRMIGSAECLCIRSEILTILNDNGRGT